MNKAIQIILLLKVLFLISCTDVRDQRTGFVWDLENEKIHNENRNDSTKWSYASWIADTKTRTLRDNPLISGVFPVPEYDLADSTFNGLGRREIGKE